MWSLTGDGTSYHNTEQRQKRWQVIFVSNVLDLSWNIPGTHATTKEADNIGTSRYINLFSDAEDINYVQLGFP